MGCNFELFKKQNLQEFMKKKIVNKNKTGDELIKTDEAYDTYFQSEEEFLKVAMDHFRAHCLISHKRKIMLSRTLTFFILSLILILVLLLKT